MPELPDHLSARLDEAYAWIMDALVQTGRGPHFTEVARSLGVAMEDGKAVVHRLMELTPGWAHPGTDYIASFPPFNVQPTQYRISVEGEESWYGQCGFESLAVRWLVPGRTVRIEAPCLDCGDLMVVEMRDEEILLVEPDTLVGYTSTEVGGDAATRPFR